MMPKYTVNPVSTGNQPLAINAVFQGATLSSAEVGVLGHWNFGKLLEDKHPFDALQMVLRSNSHLSVAHGLAAAKALEDMVGIKPNFNGMLARNILLAGEYLYYHLFHFYQGVIFTFSRGPNEEDKVPPFQVRVPPQVNKVFVEHYWQAIYIRTRIQEMMSLLSGKAPHHVAIVPGGLSDIIDTRKIIKLLSYQSEIESFIKNTYAKDVETLMQFYPEWLNKPLGGANLFCVEAYPEKLQKNGQQEQYYFAGAVMTNGMQSKPSADKLTVDYYASWSNDAGEGRNSNPAAYSWVGAGRYQDAPAETGSLARCLVNQKQAQTGLGDKIRSVLGREMVKVNECLDLVEHIRNWLDFVQPMKPLINAELIVPKEGAVTTFVESAAGPVCHRIVIESEKIKEYKIIDPIVFNLSPKDQKGEGGPVEQALVGTVVSNAQFPIELIRVLRAFE